jgi:restriction endonuclease S subunit
MKPVNVEITAFLGLEISLPPIDEQRRISSLFKTIRQRIEVFRRLIEPIEKDLET